MEGNFFSSIRWRFITIYFLLVFTVMAIIGVVVINALENAQLDKVQQDAEQTLNSIISSSGSLSREDWREASSDIQNTLNEWRFNVGEAVYIIDNDTVPEIIASSVNTRDLIQGSNALSYKELNPNLILEGLKGREGNSLREDKTTGTRYFHNVAPVYDNDGDVQGILYMVTNLNRVYSVIKDTRVILTYATIFALVITSLLGFFLSNSITKPIRGMTQIASELAKGNFDQKVEVKSDDEIGRLGSMFNTLTVELQDTINQMELDRSRLEIIFSYMDEGVIAMDRKGDFLLANPVAQDILHLSSHEDLSLSNTNAYPILNLLNISDINYFDNSSLTGTSQIEIEDCVYNVRYAPFKNKKGENIGLILVMQDITQEYNLEVMRKEFVANVSHELKTPITTIKSYTETLMGKELGRETNLRFLSIIEREADRMSRLVTDLLQLSNMDANKTEWKIETIDVYEAVTNVLESLYPMIKDKHHKVELDIPENINGFMGDRHGVDQVLMNILSNAIKYTTYGGIIRITARNYGVRVHIEISDTGVGISKKDLDRIFERFYRVDKNRARSSGGTGLGLSIAKEVIESMNGRIKIRSKIREGTTVLLSFPVDKEVL